MPCVESGGGQDLNQLGCGDGLVHNFPARDLGDRRRQFLEVPGVVAGEFVVRPSCPAELSTAAAAAA